MAKKHDSVSHSALSVNVRPKFSPDAEPLVGTSSKFKEYLELQNAPVSYSQRRSPVDFWKLTSLQDFCTFSHSQDWQYPVIDTNQHENSLDKGTTRYASQAHSDTSKFKRQHEFDETLNRNEQHLTKNSDDSICQKSCDEATSRSTHRTLNEPVPFKKGPLKLRKSWFNPRYRSLASHCKHFANQESGKQTNAPEVYTLDFPDEHTPEMDALEGIYRNSNRQRRSQMPTNFGTLIENPTDVFHLNAPTTSEASCSPSRSCQQCQKSCSPMDEVTPGTTTRTPNCEKAGPPVPPKSTAPVVSSKTQHRLRLREYPPIKTCKHADFEPSKVSQTKPYSKKSNLTMAKQLSLAHENDAGADSPPPFIGTYFPPRQQQFDAYGFVRHNYYSHMKPTSQSPSFDRKKQSFGRKGANQQKGEKPVVSFHNRVSMHTINATKSQHNLQNHDIHPHHDAHHHEHPHHHHLHHNPNPQNHFHHSSSSSSPHARERGKSYVYLNDIHQHQSPTAIDEHLDVATCKPAARTLNTPAALAPAINDEDEDDDASSTKSAPRPKRSNSRSSYSYSSSSSSSDLGNMKKKLKVFPAKHSKKRKNKEHAKHSTEISPHHKSSQEFNVTKGDGTSVSEPATENAKKTSTNSKLEEQASDDDGDTEGSSTSDGSKSSSKKDKDSIGSSGSNNSAAKSKGRSCDDASQKKALTSNPCCYYINTCPSYTYGCQQGGYYGYGGYPGGAQSAYALPNAAYGTYGSPYDPNAYSGTQWPLDPFSCCYPPHTEGPRQVSHLEKLSSRCASPNKESPPPPCQASGYNQQPFSPQQLWTNQCLEPFNNMNASCFHLSPNAFLGQAQAPSQTQDLNGNYSQSGYFGNPYCCPMIFYCCPPQPEPPKEKKPCRRKKAVKKNVFQLPPALTSFPDKPRGCTLESPPKCNNCCPDDYCCASDGDCCNNFCCFENCKCPVGML